MNGRWRRAQQLCVIALGIFSCSVFASQNDQQVIARGKYLATAADCAACHRGSNQQDAPMSAVMPSRRRWATSSPAISRPPKEPALATTVNKSFAAR
ncbi:c-type cytochrome [Serratia ureilytica]